MKFTTAFCLIVETLTCVQGLSYLDSLSGKALQSLQPAGPPELDQSFFFTDGVKESPSDIPEFFFAEVPPSPAWDLSNMSVPKGSGDYLSTLGCGAALVAGPGIQSYIDAVGQTNTPFEVVPTAPQTLVTVIESDYDIDAPTTSGEYLGGLSAGATPTASVGRGIVNYLDSLPRTASTSGAGLKTYKDSLPTTNRLIGSGVGLQGYTDSLGLGGSARGNVYSSVASVPSATLTASSMIENVGTFSRLMDVTADAIRNIKSSGVQTAKFTGRAFCR